MASSDKTFVAYFQSWSEKWSEYPKKLPLANIAPYVNMVIVSFIRPDCTYGGNNKLAGTGLDFSADGVVVKDAIAQQKSKNPGTKVLVAVGGATYQNFAALNTKAIADVVKDFGFDGVDIDYEPFNNGQCSSSNGQVTCTTDAEYRRIVNEIRQALPRPYLVTVAAWSIGAYGEGHQKRAEVMQDLFGPLGINISLLRQPIGASDFSWEAWTFDDTTNNTDDWSLSNFFLWREDAYIRPMLDMAYKVNPGRIKIFATPWSPPAWMRSNKRLYGNGGYLRYECYSVYADS